MTPLDSVKPVTAATPETQTQSTQPAEVKESKIGNIWGGMKKAGGAVIDFGGKVVDTGVNVVKKTGSVAVSVGEKVIDGGVAVVTTVPKALEYIDDKIQPHERTTTETYDDGSTATTYTQTNKKETPTKVRELFRDTKRDYQVGIDDHRTITIDGKVTVFKDKDGNVTGYRQEMAPHGYPRQDYGDYAGYKARRKIADVKERLYDAQGKLISEIKKDGTVYNSDGQKISPDKPKRSFFIFGKKVCDY